MRTLSLVIPVYNAPDLSRAAAAAVPELARTAEACGFSLVEAIFVDDGSEPPLELSEGMKVKVNLMLALAHRSDVLILDEPTSGLDPFSRNELLEVFNELRNHGVTVFFSTHIISDIEKCADDIVYISKGRIVAATPKADFIREYSEPGESLEDTMLRLEGGAVHA